MTADVVRSPERRPVRVTIEGEAYHPAGDDRVLIVVRADGAKLALTQGLGVTVEDIEPARVWTDGDVVQGMRVWERRDGEWFAALSPGLTVDASDADISADVAARAMRVLRYQHGGDA